MSNNRIIRLSRRSLLTGLAASAVVTPFMTGLLAQIARAQTTTVATRLRFVLMFTGNGQHPEHWVPKGGETNFKLSPVLEPLKEHRRKLLLMRGLSGKAGHSGGMSETLTGWPARMGEGVPENGPSIDQFLANRFRNSTPLPSLELGVFPDNQANDQSSYSASGLPIPAIGSPRGAFDRIFGITNGDSNNAKRRRAQQASVLDLMTQDLDRINQQLGSEARILLDEHLTLIRSKEEDLRKPYKALQCDLPNAPENALKLKATWKAQNDNIIGALRCGVTRIATLRAGGWGGIESGKYDEIGIPGGHHNIAHVGPDAHLIGINRFHAQQFAYLLDALDDIEEGEGTMLDSTVAIWINELGLGEFNHHSRSDVHVVLAGGAKAGMRNGAYLDLRTTDYQDFLFTLTRLMGVTDISKFGDHGSTIIESMFR